MIVVTSNSNRACSTMKLKKKLNKPLKRQEMKPLIQREVPACFSLA